LELFFSGIDLVLGK